MATGLMRMVGWQVEGRLPDEPRFVVTVAPHTSNWDFLVAMGAMFAVGLRLSWLGKHSAFRGPAVPVLRWLGGEPIDRSVSGGTVTQAIERFASSDRFALGVAPEGTRSRVTTWKTGFHRIALGAGVPIMPVYLDYGRRRVTLGALVWPSADAEADVRTLRASCRKDMARHPERFVAEGEVENAG
jgi:1-acyl-sn-glycerol-3-phosphate acyltransferase